MECKLEHHVDEEREDERAVAPTAKAVKQTLRRRTVFSR